MAVNEYDFFETDPMYATNAENAEKTAAAPTLKSDGMHDTEPVKFPIPESDYKNGKLKKVRGRMLKKLLKYEMEYLFLPVLIGSILVLVFSLLLGLQIRTLAKGNTEVTAPLFSLFITLYGYSAFAMLILPIGLSDRRMRKNFFKGEGAVTFSIPASAEEHLFAKHLATMITGAISFVAVALSVFILLLLIGALKDLPPVIFPDEEINLISFIFHILESLLFIAEFVVGLPVVIGAVCCFTQRFSGKKNWMLGLVIAIAVITFLNVASTLFFTTNLYQILQTDLGLHLFAWGQLLLGAGLIVLCFLYELRTIKYKINL